MSNTPIAFTTEDFVTGYLGESNSKDYFTLDVNAGQTYSIAFIGVGQDRLLDADFSAVDENGSPVTLADNGASPDWYEKKFTAASSGKVTFELALTNFDLSGQYGLKVTEGLQNNFSTLMGAAALSDQGAWGPGRGDSTTVTYGFRASPAPYVEQGEDLTTFSLLTAPQIDAVNLALALWSEVSNIKFEAINPGGYTDDATILFSNYRDTSPGGAFAISPEKQGDRRSESNEGDVWLNLNEVFKEAAPVQGTYSFWVLIHEIGHAIGLSHPGPYNADGKAAITYAKNAKFIQDSSQYTVMSYFDGSETGQLPGIKTETNTPQLFDILAMQNKYGSNMQTRSGDTIYGFESNAGPIYDFALNSSPQFSIWDGGGIDTLNASEFSQQQIINLNPNTFSNIGGQIYNISIALNVSIENAVGGSGADSLYGNALENRIQAGAGDDSIEGSYANDDIDGGEGIDYAVYAASISTMIAAVRDASGLVTIRTSFGTDTLSNIESVSFSDDTVSIEELLGGYAPPVYQTNAGQITANIYAGPVDFLNFQMLGTASSDIVNGSSENDFMNLLGGDDAASGGGGQDVLDGGVGSNFLTGGSGSDIFFIDNRIGSNTWSTITDFGPEDSVNIWGWQQGTSQLILSLDNQGAEGFKGATFHYDLNGNGMIDTSITFSSLALASMSSPIPEEIAGNGYLLFA
jgi:serralysin